MKTDVFGGCRAPSLIEDWFDNNHVETQNPVCSLVAMCCTRLPQDVKQE